MGKKKREIPYFQTPMVETHCHFDYLKEHTTQELIQLSHNVNIDRFITISVSPSNLDAVCEIAKNHSPIYCSQGIHPHEAKTWSDEVEKKIISNLKKEKVIAIGETGLDYYYTKSPIEKQKKVFKKQLTIADTHQLPVIIHTRDADDDTIEILSQFKHKLSRKGVIHSFTSTPKLAEFALDMGFYLGFNGIITFKNAEAVRDIVRLCPLERILLETDSPFLTPDPYRGHENGPHYIPFIAEKIAEIKKVEVEDLLQQVLKNSNTLFFS